MKTRTAELVLTEHDDLSLAQRVIDGDEDAFERLFDDHVQRLFRYALAQLGNREVAQDMVQATFYKAMEKLHTYRGEGSLWAWLRTVCRFEMSAYLRREQRHAASSIDDHQLDFEDPKPSPGKRAEQHELADQVQEVLFALPNHYRQILEWKYSEGLRVDDIAKRLGMGLKATESLLTRARGAFKKSYRERLDLARSATSRRGGHE